MRHGGSLTQSERIPNSCVIRMLSSWEKMNAEPMNKYNEIPKEPSPSPLVRLFSHFLEFRKKVYLTYKEILNKGIITILDQAFVSAGSFITGIIVARVCNKTEFGFFVLGLTIIVFARSLQSSLITSPYMIRIAKIDETERDSFSGSTFIHQLVLALTSGFLLMGVFFFFRREYSGMSTVISAVALALPFILIKEYIRAVSLARLHLHSVLFCDSLILCVQVIGVLLFASYHTLAASATILVIGISNAVVGISWMVWRHGWFKLKIREICIHMGLNLGLGKWLLASSFIYTFSKELYPWMLTFFHSPEATGTFGACLGVIFISSPFVIGLTNFLGPLANSVYANKGKQELFNLIRKSTLLIAAVMGLFCSILFIFGQDILTFIYGSKYSGNGFLISALGLSIFTSVLTTPIGLGLWALERTDLNFKACLCSLIVTLSIGILLVKYMGPLGAGLSLLIGNVFESLFKYYKFMKLNKFTTVAQVNR
jgi:O-antigen/teichoic acid export membrane protein